MERKIFGLFFLIILYTLTYGASITVTSPKTGDIWCINQPYPITWTKSGEMHENVRIRLMNHPARTVALPIVNSTPTDDESYSWTIPATVAPGSYFMRVRTTDAAVWGDGEVFEIKECEISITITSPNGGETYNCGGTLHVRWSFSGITGIVRVILKRGSTNVLDTTVSTSSEGMAWYIPETIAPSTNYRVRIETLDGSIWDESDGTFTIRCRPDLFIREISTDPGYTSKTPKEGDTVFIKVKIGNKGARNTTPFKARITIENPPGSQKKVRDIRITKALDPSKYTLIAETCECSQAGWYKVKVDLDIDHDVTELDENNNDGWTGWEAHSCPDLAVCLEYPKRKVPLNRDTSIRVWVKNIGSKRSPQSKLKFYIQGHGETIHAVRELNPGEEIRFKRKHQWNSPGKRATLAFIDYDHQITETKERNNKITSSIYVKRSLVYPSLPGGRLCTPGYLEGE